MEIIKNVKPQILCFSGGKDSTALALWALDTPQTFKIDGVVCFSTGWDFPEVEENQRNIIEKFQKRGLKAEIVDSTYCGSAHNSGAKDFEFLFSKIQSKTRDVKGWGFPHIRNRWCTGVKIDTLKKWKRNNFGKDYIAVIGLAADELGRIKKLDSKYQIAPLNNAKMTERDCLQMCYDHGIHFGGVYEHINRASCFLCPLANLIQLRYVYFERQELWQRLRDLSAKAPYWLFKYGLTVEEYELRFELEKKYPMLPNTHILRMIFEKTGKTSKKANGKYADLVAERVNYEPLK